MTRPSEGQESPEVEQMRLKLAQQRRASPFYFVYQSYDPDIIPGKSDDPRLMCRLGTAWMRDEATRRILQNTVETCPDPGYMCSNGLGMFLHNTIRVGNVRVRELASYRPDEFSGDHAADVAILAPRTHAVVGVIGRAGYTSGEYPFVSVTAELVAFPERFFRMWAMFLSYLCVTWDVKAEARDSVFLVLKNRDMRDAYPRGWPLPPTRTTVIGSVSVTSVLHGGAPNPHVPWCVPWPVSSLIGGSTQEMADYHVDLGPYIHTDLPRGSKWVSRYDLVDPQTGALEIQSDVVTPASVVAARSKRRYKKPDDPLDRASESLHALFGSIKKKAAGFLGVEIAPDEDEGLAPIEMRATIGDMSSSADEYKTSSGEDSTSTASGSSSDSGDGSD